MGKLSDITKALTQAVEKANRAAESNARKTAAKVGKASGSSGRNTAAKGSTQKISTLPKALNATQTASPRGIAGGLCNGGKASTIKAPTGRRSASANQIKGKGNLNPAFRGVAQVGLGQKTAKAVTAPYTAQYLPLTADFRISSPYGVDRVTHRHSGIDLAVPEGTQVAAAKTGTVSFAGWGNGYGYRVVVDHPDGTQTTYNHLSDIGVKVGDRVRAGNTIALSGNTGNSTGPHLHFEVKKDGQYVDPELYFDFGNGIKAAGSNGYTSQMAAASSKGSAASSGSSSSSSGSSRSRSSGSSGSSRSSGKSSRKSVALPAIDYSSATPKLTAYSPRNGGSEDYFTGTMNPLLGLVPRYRHSGVGRS